MRKMIGCTIEFNGLSPGFRGCLFFKGEDVDDCLRNAENWLITTAAKLGAHPPAHGWGLLVLDYRLDPEG